MLKEIIKSMFFITILIIILFIIFTPDKKDIEAYNKCLNNFDTKTCQKMIYGKY